MMRNRGFTLAELLAVTVILGILAAMVTIPHTRTLEQARFRAARDILQAIYAGERTYWAMNDDNYCAVPGACTWDEIYVDDPNSGGGVIPGVVFSVTVGGGGTTFLATATRAAGACPWDTTIDQIRAAGGANPTVGTVCP